MSKTKQPKPPKVYFIFKDNKFYTRSGYFGELNKARVFTNSGHARNCCHEHKIEGYDLLSVDLTNVKFDYEGTF